MPQLIEVPFTGPTYQSESTFLQAQECTNFYLRPYPDAGQDKFALFGTPGLESFVDLGTSKSIRGTIAAGVFLFAVSSDSFFRVSTNGIATEIGAGTIKTDSGPVGMSQNGLDVLVLDGDNGYVYDLSAGTLTQITDADFQGGNVVSFLDGFYFVPKPASNQIYQSTINDGTSWPLLFDSAGKHPDDVVGILASQENVWTFGDQSTQPWYNGVASGFILTPFRGSLIEKGTSAQFSPAKGDNGVFWLGKDGNGDGQVFQAVGFQAKVVSAFPISFAIKEIKDSVGISDAEGFVYQQLGHTFYVLNFPAGDQTWVYDVTTGFWHRRSSRITDDAGIVRDGRWRIATHTFFNGDHIVGDFDNGKLYKLKTDVYDEDGTVMIATRVAQTLRSNQSRITVHELQVLTEPGVGLVTGQGSSPQMSISWSVDGGITFFDPADVSIGKTGEFANRAILRSLGQGRNWAEKVTISDPIKRVILGGFMNFTQDRD